MHRYRVKQSALVLTAALERASNDGCRLAVQAGYPRRLSTGNSPSLQAKMFSGSLLLTPYHVPSSLHFLRLQHFFNEIICLSSSLHLFSSNRLVFCRLLAGGSTLYSQKVSSYQCVCYSIYARETFINRSTHSVQR